MVQQGQTIELTRRGADGRPLWAYRYRTGGRDSNRVQRGGFASEQDARDALERELERVRREQRIGRRLTLAELVDTYLAQHYVQPVTIEKLRYLLSKATAVFGDRKIGELTSQEIAQWRMNLSPGYRFEATQALRQVLHRAVAWGMLDVNPAKVGVDNPVRRRKEQHPFESWAELETLVQAIGPRYGLMILSPRRPGWGRRSGSRSRNVTSTARSASSMSAAPSPAASSRSRRQKRACARSRSKLARLTPSTGSRMATARRCFSPASGAATSTSTTSAPTNGDPHRRPPASRRPDGSTISGTPSRPSRSVPASQPSTSLAIGRQPHDDRPPLRQPRPRRTRARDQAARCTQPAAVDAGLTLGWTPKHPIGVTLETKAMSKQRES